MNIHIPNSNSPCDLWKTYLQQLQKEVGKENAKVLWLMTWQENGAVSCTTNPSFNDFLKKNDIEVSNLATKAIAESSELGMNILGLGKRLSKFISIGVPIALTGALAVILFMLFKTAKETDAKAIIKLAATKGMI
ncbi:MAG: hypothetical protein AAFO82_00050 [Bacteroidota bacterium]